jgi:hypothetical protein
MREPPNLDIPKRTPLFFATAIQLDNLAQWADTIRQGGVIRRKRKAVPAQQRPLEDVPAPAEIDQISVAEAVDFDIDELRADVDEWRGEGDGFVTNGRTSIASSVDRGRRESIASEFFNHRMSDVSLLSSDWDALPSVVDPPSRLKDVIVSELIDHGKRSTSVVDFTQVCPEGVSRLIAARALSHIVVLASRGDIRIKHNPFVNFASNKNLLFSIVSADGGSSSSSSDY